MWQLGYVKVDINDTQHNNAPLLCWKKCFIYYYAECRYAECHYDEYRYAGCRYTECRGASWLHSKIRIEKKERKNESLLYKQLQYESLISDKNTINGTKWNHFYISLS